MAGTAYGAASDGTPSNRANKYIDSLAGGSRWYNSSGSSGTVTISYALLDGADPYGLFSGNGYSWSVAFEAALTGAMSAWEAVAAVDFVSTTYDAADIWYWSNDRQCNRYCNSNWWI